MSWRYGVSANDLLEPLDEKFWKHHCLDLTAASQKEPPPPAPKAKPVVERWHRVSVNHQENVLEALRDQDGLTLEEIRQFTGVCRSVTNVNALALLEQGAVTRRREPCDNGGFRHRYYLA